MFVNGVYRPSTASDLLISSLKPSLMSNRLKNHNDEIRTSTNIPSNRIFSSSNKQNIKEKLPFNQIFKKVSQASASKGSSLITSSTWSAPIINSSPVPINLFVPKPEHINEDANNMKDFQHSESQKVYAPAFAQPRPGGPGHVIEKKGK